MTPLEDRPAASPPLETQPVLAVPATADAARDRAWEQADFTQVVSRNIVPVVGVLLLGWNARNVLLLYYADTLLGIGAQFGALFAYYYRTRSRQKGLRTIASFVVGGTILLAVFALPLGVPLAFMLGGEIDWAAVRADSGFHAALGWQAVAAVWSAARLAQALRDATPEQLRVKRRFALVMMRWLAVMFSAFFGVAALLGRYSPLFFVVVYASVSIWAEIAPDRFLHAMSADDPNEATRDDARASDDAGAGRSIARHRRRHPR